MSELGENLAKSDDESKDATGNGIRSDVERIEQVAVTGFDDMSVTDEIEEKPTARE